MSRAPATSMETSSCPTVASQFRYVLPAQERLLRLAQWTLGRFPLRHGQVRRVIERMGRRQLVDQGKLPAVPPREDHHAGNGSAMIGHHLAQLADTIASRGDVVQNEELLARANAA